MLRSLLDLAPGQTEPYLPLRNADHLDGGGGNDMVSLMEVTPEVDDEIALTWCIARPGDLAGIPVNRLDLKVLDAVVVAEHSFGNDQRRSLSCCPSLTRP